jgi:hypothetical protein
MIACCARISATTLTFLSPLGITELILAAGAFFFACRALSYPHWGSPNLGILPSNVSSTSASTLSYPHWGSPNYIYIYIYIYIISFLSPLGITELFNELPFASKAFLDALSYPHWGSPNLIVIDNVLFLYFTIFIAFTFWGRTFLSPLGITELVVYPRAFK